jgi:hypothetical protein
LDAFRLIQSVLGLGVGPAEAKSFTPLRVGVTKLPINHPPRFYPGKNPDLDLDTIDALANKIDRCPLMMEAAVLGAGRARWVVGLRAAGAGRMFRRSFGVVHSHHLSEPVHRWQ